MKPENREREPRSKNGRAETRSGGRVFVLLFVAFFLAALTLVVRLPDLSMPLERDEGEYAYAAQEILRGGMPYADSFCQKPPVVFFWYIGGFLAAGETVEGIHLAMAAAAALAAFGLFLLCLFLLRSRPAGETGPCGRDAGSGTGGRAGALLAAAAFTAASAGSGYFGSAANTEIFMAVPVVFGVLLLLKAAAGEGGRFAWAGAGFLCGLAFMTKQVALFSFLGPGIYALILLGWREKGFFRRLGAGLLQGAAGALAAMGGVAAWLAAGRAFGPFLEAAFGYNVSYVGSPFGLWKWKQVIDLIGDRFLATDGVLWLSMAACLALLLLSEKVRRKGAVLFVVLWFFSSLPGAALGPKTMGHYFLQVLPPLAAGAGVLLEEILERLAGRKAAAYALPGLLAAAVLLPPALGRFHTLARPAAERSFELYKAYSDCPPFVAAEAVGKHLEETTAPGDRILVVGSEPEILFYARRRSATRFTIFYPFTGTFSGSDAMTEELFREIAGRPPRKVVLAREGVFFLTGRETAAQMKAISARVREILGRVAGFLGGGYVEECRVYAGPGGRALWRGGGGEGPEGAPALFHIFTRRE